MEFCPNCGSRLEPKKIGSDNAFVLSCTKCGHTKQPIDRKAEARTGKVIQPKTTPFMTIISEADQQITPMQTIKMKCEKCDNNLVYVWQVQTRGGDEASTQFMRCTKCGHTFREYA
ncbi:MAG: transcription factor S [Candidatus Bathyarchaeota archaeon]|nr:transcription factor S [Candidatus Bathyarchaeota archaeon]